MADTKTIKIDVPESLAREIRRCAEVSRRSIREVADTVLSDAFKGISAEDVRRQWMAHLANEMGGSEEEPAAHEAKTEEQPAEAEESGDLAFEGRNARRSPLASRSWATDSSARASTRRPTSTR